MSIQWVIGKNVNGQLEWFEADSAGNISNLGLGLDVYPRFQDVPLLPRDETARKANEQRAKT